MGGMIAAIESGELKRRLVESNARRIEAIERGELKVVGVNCFTTSEPSPLTAGEGAIHVSSPEAEREQIERLQAWRAERDAGRVERALAALRAAARSGANIMPASIEAAKAGATTGEWGAALRGRIRRVSRPDRRRQPRPPAVRRPRRAARRSRARVDQARPSAEAAGRQAGPRRPFQRRRADRDARARRRTARSSTTASA